MLKRAIFWNIILFVSQSIAAQEPISWGPDMHFSTFSIAAIDPVTRESGVAVTTRVACVGNAVPWVRAGVGAVATQASTRVEYGKELLDFIESGMNADDAMIRAVAGDSMSARRQIGVISLDGTKAQHTGTGPSHWAGHREGTNYVTQGNILVGPEVLAAVAESFEASEDTERHLSDRLIEALMAGQIAGGDKRDGRLQSAAVIVADPRPGNSRRQDQVTTNINVCENPTPVTELRRIYNSISQTLGYRDLQRLGGNDVWQLRVLLHAIGYYKPDADDVPLDAASQTYTEDAVDAVHRFRVDQGLWTPRGDVARGLVDQQTLSRIWQSVEEAGKTLEVRKVIRDAIMVRR
ncbi:MAG: DUF1028 domain-containing protein [Longimicrobiales bacterium]|nr:DUF1028 domain-containing protein [Longimicrobiales bacterium]